MSDFLHGVEVLELDSGPRPIRIYPTAVIGIVGTAPNGKRSISDRLFMFSYAAYDPCYLEKSHHKQ